MAQLILHKAIKFFLVFCILFTTPIYAKQDEVGSIGQVKGSGVLERGKTVVIDGKVGALVQSMDEAVTANGTMRIDFVDETRVELTEQSRLVIDEFVYDPANDLGSIGLKASLGTVRYASGQIAKKYKQNVKIRTPSATIGVRGTDFIMTVDEFGGSMITLLPSCDTAGMCYTGEITVETDAGFVIMNQAFQATSVSAVESRPLKPVLLDLELDMINNLLIITPPKKLEEAIEEEKFRATANALDLDFLKFDDLEVDMLEVEEDEYASALDIDFLDQDFLVDILDQLNKQLALQMRSEFDKKKDVKKSGKDEFGVILLIEEPQWVWTRLDAAQNNIVLRLDMENSYTINVTQGDTQIIDYELGDGGQNQIRIYQNQ